MIVEAASRKRMVEEQIKRRGIHSKAVIAAMLKVERHLFVPEKEISAAYGDFPLPIGFGQTISQPYIVAYMTDMLQLSGDEHVLEVGTGSGYQTAVLAEVSKMVFSVEIIGALFIRAKSLLESLGYENIEFIEGDGYSGLPDFSPFDRIILTAAAPKIPRPLEIQLKEDGMLLMPFGDPYGYQELAIFRKQAGKLRRTSLTGVRFVPMTGQIARS
jgi:protein-L-isoaspartate(D-aspartate) O-methyltransferase